VLRPEISGRFIGLGKYNMSKHNRSIYSLEIQRAMGQIVGDIDPGGASDNMDFCILTFTHCEFDLSPEIFKIHGVAPNKIKDFGTIMLMRFGYHEVGEINRSQNLGKRLIPPRYRLLMPDPYVYWSVRIRLSTIRFSPGFSKKIFIVLGISHYFPSHFLK
jgi:hypothetical protein